MSHLMAESAAEWRDYFFTKMAPFVLKTMNAFKAYSRFKPEMHQYMQKGNYISPEAMKRTTEFIESAMKTEKNSYGDSRWQSLSVAAWSGFTQAFKTTVTVMAYSRPEDAGPLRITTPDFGIFLVQVTKLIYYHLGYSTGLPPVKTATKITKQAFMSILPVDVFGETPAPAEPEQEEPAPEEPAEPAAQAEEPEQQEEPEEQEEAVDSGSEPEDAEKPKTPSKLTPLKVISLKTEAASSGEDYEDDEDDLGESDYDSYESNDE